jgi:hypothetical protein
MAVQTERIGTADLWQRFAADPIGLHRQAADEMRARGIEDRPTMSRVLEHLSPSEGGESLDAFGRLMQHAGIRVASDPQAGYWASHVSDFLRDQGTRALMQEFFARKWRKAIFASPQERAILLSGEPVPGSWERPYADAQMARWELQLAAAIPLSELVGATVPISGQDYRALYLEYDPVELRKFRVGESADIPIATIETREHIIALRKYGRGLRASYEQMRRMRVDKFARMIAYMAIQSEIDKVAAALDIIVNGDGNTDTAAAVHNLTTLDTAAVAGTLTLKGWLAFKMKFVNPYIVTTALMQEAVALQLALLNTGSANVPLTQVTLGGLNQPITPINQTSDGVRYGWTSEAPALKIVGFDRRFALEQVVEIGADITESERFITNQTEVLVMSEVNGFAVNDPNAALILDVNA